MPRFARSLAALATLAAILVSTEPASAHRSDAAVRVEGAVTNPASYSLAQLAGLQQTTLPDLRSQHPGGRTVTGVLLEDLVESSTPVLPDVKNAMLRVSVTVSGRHKSVATALGELDPNFGNHPALLVETGRSRNRSVELVFPGDRGYRRTVAFVSRIDVSVAQALAPAGVPTGAVLVDDGRHVATLSAAELASLPTETVTVSFTAGTGEQQHTETGPALAAVLRAAQVRTSPTTSVAAVGSDSYVAVVTPAEAISGRRPLLLSTTEDGVALTQPRIVVDGDVKGGRYVSDVVELVVSQGCRRH